MLKLFKTPEINFYCDAEDWGIIPKPYPARHLMPDWFKALPMKLGDKGMEQSTIKRCNPFLDSMNLGWIIPSAADVSLHVSEDGSSATWRTNFAKPMISNHGHRQISSPKNPNPVSPKIPLKFMNHWFMKPAKGYSLLCVQPLNRVDPRFTFFSGFVDADKYFEKINFPFTCNVNGFSEIIPQGTPLMQVIPIKRDTLIKKADIHSITEDEKAEVAFTRAKRAAHESYYRDELVEKK